MAIHKNATAISKLRKMQLQFLQTLKTPLQTSKNATENGMKWHFSKFENCSGIFQNLQIWSGIYQINPC